MIRTRSDVWRWNVANAHGGRMHEAVAMLRQAAQHLRQSPAPAGQTAARTPPIKPREKSGLTCSPELVEAFCESVFRGPINSPPGQSQAQNIRDQFVEPAKDQLAKVQLSQAVHGLEHDMPVSFDWASRSISGYRGRAIVIMHKLKVVHLHGLGSAPAEISWYGTCNSGKTLRSRSPVSLMDRGGCCCVPGVLA